MVPIIGFDGRGSEVIRTPPVGIDLCTELPADVAATPALERAVVALVEAPAASYGRIARTSLGDNDVGGVNGADQQWVCTAAGSMPASRISLPAAAA